MSRLLASLAEAKEGAEGGCGNGTVAFVGACVKDKVEFLGFTGPGLKSILTLR